MIQALLLDIDGVMVGEKIGFNSPYPHPDVTNRLAAIRAKGIPVILCTAKPHYSIMPIIEAAHLANPHITYAGGVIIDPLGNDILESHPLPKHIVAPVISAFLSRGLYTELYTLNEYYILRTQKNDLTRVHTHILQQEPVLADSLEAIAETQDIFKIMPIVPDESGMPIVEDALSPFKEFLEITWSVHPIAMPHQFCGVAEKGISKRQAAITILSRLSIRPDDVLGIGDSTSDWKFMELCGYVATLENGQDPLKKLVTAKGDSGFTGGHVDENGILTVFDHFNLP